MSKNTGHCKVIGKVASLSTIESIKKLIKSLKIRYKLTKSTPKQINEHRCGSFGQYTKCCDMYRNNAEFNKGKIFRHTCNICKELTLLDREINNVN